MILGIDPGVANTGWGVLDDRSSVVGRRLVGYGVIETKKTDNSGKRLSLIANGIREIISKYPIDVVAVETLFFAKNAKSAIKVAEAIGVIKLVVSEMGVELKEVTPLQVKMALVGYGRAEKSQVEFMVKKILETDENIRPSHAADAVAVAVAVMS
ncbi:MAG: crossover junction endodeoxyribonuclease RuvC [Candidatus Shapirobacteria bacterium]|jgi:crossover junction endodeoxyribonuclease RuvC